MQHRIETEQIGDLDIPDVLEDCGDVGHLAAGCECAALEEIVIQAYDFVPSPIQHRGQDRSDISPVPRYEYAHTFTFPKRPRGARPFPRAVPNCACRA